MKKEKINFIFNPFNVDIQYCLNNNISYIDVIIIKYINYCLSNYKMIKIKNINEKGEEIEYVWLDIDTLCFSLQMLELSKISMIRRIAKMCDENKILKLVKCDEGTKFKKTYYSLPIDTINAINGYESKQCENSNSEIEFNNIKKEKENENPKVDEKQELEIQAIFELWNKQKIIVHKELTDKIRKEIIKALKTNDFETIKTCILRYNEALKSGFKLCQYKWTLDTFLKQKNAMIDFIDEGSKWNSYQDWLKQKNNKPYSPYEDLPEDGYGEYGVKI